MTTAVVVREDASLETNPTEHMAVVLNRAKEWLAEAQSIDEIREKKAIAVGLENFIREKELAFDAQLSATEIVRRCERRMAELVHEGQREGTILKRGQRLSDRRRNGDLPQRPHEAMGVSENDRGSMVDSYAMAKAPAENFEQALTVARDEGNLSRANVVRRVKGESMNGASRPDSRVARAFASMDYLEKEAIGLARVNVGLIVSSGAVDEALRSLGTTRRTVSTYYKRLKEESCK